jgi:hypothetical protein
LWQLTALRRLTVDSADVLECDVPEHGALLLGGLSYLNLWQISTWPSGFFQYATGFRSLRLVDAPSLEDVRGDEAVALQVERVQVVLRSMPYLQELQIVQSYYIGAGFSLPPLLDLHSLRKVRRLLALGHAPRAPCCRQQRDAAALACS